MRRAHTARKFYDASVQYTSTRLSKNTHRYTREPLEREAGVFSHRLGRPNGETQRRQEGLVTTDRVRKLQHFGLRGMDDGDLVVTREEILHELGDELRGHFSFGGGTVTRLLEETRELDELLDIAQPVVKERKRLDEF